MGRSTASMAILVVLAGLVACLPVGYATTATFSPPPLVLDSETQEQWFRIRLCYRGDAGDYPMVLLRVLASSPTPMRATMFVDAEHNETEIITATEEPEALGPGARWDGDEVDHACESGVVVGFARIESDEVVPDPSLDRVTIDWLIWAHVGSNEESAESLALEVYVEALDGAERPGPQP
jgi:hypothetical protein